MSKQTEVEQLIASALYDWTRNREHHAAARATLQALRQHAGSGFAVSADGQVWRVEEEPSQPGLYRLFEVIPPSERADQ